MNRNKKLFNYKNNIILTNGSSIKITSVKYFKNYQLNFRIFKKTKTVININNQNKLSFIKKII
uniref:Uncharacterized protein n=1 Tax=Bremia lactucae TaxID=4779 RepID=A0A3Q8U9L4_BRELC|nr:hypothetical protein [Bremia lactucae]AZL92959.1 hypothetical protein [Bremia lactucae]